MPNEDQIVYCYECDASMEVYDYCSECDCGTECCCQCERTSNDSDRAFYRMLAPYGNKFYRMPYEPSPRLYFGIENEMEPIRTDIIRSSTFAQQMRRLVNDDFYATTTDGSLSSYGVEVKTRPFTFDWLKKNKLRFRKLSFAMRNFTANQEERCGMHISLSRNYFTKLEELKLNTLVNSHLSEQISERYNGYTTFCKRTSDRIFFNGLKNSPVGAAKKAYIDKFSAMSAWDYKRLEVRIFQGTTDIRKIFKNIQYCHAMASFVKQSSVKATTADLLAYINKNSMQYPELVDFLSERRIS